MAHSFEVFSESVQIVMSSNLATGLTGRCEDANIAWSALNQCSAMQARRSLSTRSLEKSPASSNNRKNKVKNKRSGKVSINYGPSGKSAQDSPDNLLILPPPPQWNWNATGNTPAIKYQGLTCASCWVNSATAAVESALSIKYNVSAAAIGPFSRQAIIDCANYDNFGQDYVLDSGCEGGAASDAFSFMGEVTIPTEAAYPYTSGPTGTWSSASW